MCLESFQQERYPWQKHPVLWCRRCEEKKIWLNKKLHIDDVPVTILYAYDDWFKSVLYRYKGLGDLMLAPYFLSRIHSYLRFRFQGYRVIPAPRYVIQDQVRGFPTLKPIFEPLNMIDIFQKKDAYKQSDMPFELRNGIHEHVKIDEQALLNLDKEKPFLLIDDVLTSGETMRMMIQSLKNRGFQRLFGLVLSKPIRYDN